MKHIILMIFAISVSNRNIIENETLNRTNVIEPRSKILVFDTEVSDWIKNDSGICKDAPESSFTKYPADSHGTNVVGIILSKINKTKYCVYPESVDFSSKSSYTRSLENHKLMSSNVSGINFSIESADSVIPIEFKILDHYDKLGVSIHISAGNQKTTYSKNDCKVYPLCYVFSMKNIKIIHGSDVNASNTVKDIPFWTASGKNIGYPKLTGTSQSAAVFTGDYFK